MDFRLLGPLEVADQAGSVSVGAGKRRSLLGLLLLHPNEVLSAERLIDELWGDRPPVTAAKSLHVYVSQLRKELGRAQAQPNGSILQTRGNGYVACVGPDDLDTQRFERMLAEGQRASMAGDPAAASAKLTEAVALWRGPPLADFAYEPFAQREIGRLEGLRLVALESRIEADLKLGRHAELVGELEGLVSEHPVREGVRGQLMLALYRCGRQAEALQAYRDGRALLVSDLGLEPGPALRELERRILDQSPELAPPAAPVREPPRDAAPERSRERTGQAPTRSRRPWLVVVVPMACGAFLLGAAGLAALSTRGGGDQAARLPPLDLAPNSIAAVDASSGAPRLALPLPGRPTDLAAVDGIVWAVTVDSAALTAVDPRTKSILRTVPLTGTPAAVAVGEGAVWVADGRSGVLARVEPGYEQVSARIRFRRGRTAERTGDAASVAVGSGSVWVTDGSARLVRIDPETRQVDSIPTPGRPLDDVAAGAGAVWAISSAAPSVLRVDPGTNATERIDIARSGGEAPFPVGVAATENAVWVLNQNTATVTAIDPRTRGIVAVIPIGVDRVPNEIAAGGRTAWVANDDGTLSRIEEGASTASSLWIGESIRDVAVDGTRLWVGTTALDQQLPGGAG